MTKSTASNIQPFLTTSKALYVLSKKNPLFTINIIYKEHLMYNFIIFKRNFCRYNLKICLANSSIIYVKFMGTTILSFNIKKKFYII